MSFANPQRAKSEVTNIKGVNTFLETKADDFSIMMINKLSFNK